MKILYIVSEFEPVQNAVAIRSKSHIDALLEHGEDVSILTGPKSKNNVKYNIETTVTSSPSNRKHFLVRLCQEIVFGLEIGFRILFRKSHDHIIITSPPFIMSVIVSWFIYLKKTPYSVDIRDRYPQVMFSLKLVEKESILGKALLFLEKNLYQRAENVITVTKYLVNSIEHEVNIKSVYLVKNGFTKVICQRMNTSIQKNTPIIIMHGTFGKFFDEKVFIQILRGLSKSKLDYQVLIIGEGSKLEVLKSAKLKNVKFLEHMEQSEISSWLNKAYIGLSIHTENSSMKGAFPVKVFEYIGCGIPSIVIPISEAGRQVEDEKFGYTFASSDGEYAIKMIVNLLKDSKIHNEMRKRILQKRDLYSREYQSKVFVDILT